MSVKVDREVFLKALEAVQPGTSKRELVEQAACVIFQNGEVLTYNEEIACRMPSPLGDEIEGAAPLKPLLDQLRKWKEEEIEIEATESELIVKGKGSRSAGFRLEAEISLPVGMVEKPNKWEKLHPDFGEAVGIVQQCANDDITSITQYVHVTTKYIQSCDNFQLCRWKIATKLKKKDDDEAGEWLLRKSSIKHITSLGMGEFSETAAWVHFRNADGLVLSCRRYVDEFYDLDKALASGGEPAQLPKGLAEAADKAAVFSSENLEGNQVEISIKPGKLRIKGQGVLGWYSETRSIKYQGPPIEFLASPVLLADLVKRHTDCLIAPDRLRVDAGNYVFVACLSVAPNRNGQMNYKVDKIAKGADEEEGDAPKQKVKRRKKVKVSKGKDEEE